MKSLHQNVRKIWTAASNTSKNLLRPPRRHCAWPGTQQLDYAHRSHAMYRNLSIRILNILHFWK